MSHRQLADDRGHRWDVEDEGPFEDQDGPEREAEHQLRFTRDDGAERIRTSPRSLDRLADAELRQLLERGDAEDLERGPDIRANRSRGYGEVR